MAYVLGCDGADMGEAVAEYFPGATTVSSLLSRYEQNIQEQAERGCNGLPGFFPAGNTSNRQGRQINEKRWSSS